MYERRDRVWWWSEQSGVERRSLAVFLGYDGKRDCFLAVKGNQFRWPVKLIAPERDMKKPPQRFTGLPKRKVKPKRPKKPRG